MHREGSKYANHPRVTWFGVGGVVAYVDYTDTVVDSWFIGGDGFDRFQVIPPRTGETPAKPLAQRFAIIDDGITHVLESA